MHSWSCRSTIIRCSCPIASRSRSCAPAANADFDCTVKTRYRQKDLGCRVRYLGGGRAQIRLHHPARAVTPGQYAVFYDGEVCLGGGVIAQPQKARAELDRQVV